MNTFPTKAISSSLALALSLCLLPAASPRSDVVSPVRLIGAGATSCGTWLESRRTDNWFSMVNWALGYISAAAVWGGVGDPLRQTDADGVAYWLDNYCRVMPTSYFHEAVKAFIETFIDAAKATSGGAGAHR